MKRVRLRTFPYWDVSVLRAPWHDFNLDVLRGAMTDAEGVLIPFQGFGRGERKTFAHWCSGPLVHWRAGSGNDRILSYVPSGSDATMIVHGSANSSHGFSVEEVFALEGCVGERQRRNLEAMFAEMLFAEPMRRPLVLDCELDLNAAVALVVLSTVFESESRQVIIPNTCNLDPAWKRFLQNSNYRVNYSLGSSADFCGLSQFCAAVESVDLSAIIDSYQEISDVVPANLCASLKEKKSRTERQESWAGC